MTVFVDDPIFEWKGRMWCHMFSVDLDELHTFAVNKVGLNRKWFQQPPKASWPHYDIVTTKREIAIAAGAVPVTKQEFVFLARFIRDLHVRPNV